VTNSPNATTASSTTDTNSAKAEKKTKDTPKASEAVFVVEGDHAKLAQVKIGISDDTYWEITEGLSENQEIVSGGYKAVNRELEDGKKIRKGAPDKSEDKEKK
jgi:HlyD family secretion protein